MKLLFFILLLAFSSTRIYAMVPYIVNNEEQLFVNQHTPVWCWAAMAEALYNYHNEDKKYQDEIARNNPYAQHIEKWDMYSVQNLQDDYLLTNVLWSEKYKPNVNLFDEQKVISLLDKNHPVVVGQFAHVVMIYGYLKIGETVNFLIFDPGAHLSFMPNISLVNSWRFGNVFEGSKSIILYLDENQG